MWKRNTIIFLSSQAVSLFGSSLVQYALLWYITLETKSGTMLTLYIVCGFLPTFFLSPFGGVWADRYDRKRLIILADGLIALVTLALAVSFLTGGGSTSLIMLAAALRAAGAAVQMPAVGAILPQFVPAEHLTRVNSIAGTIHAVIALVSPIVSGALLSIWPMHYLFAVDVVTAAAAIAVLALLFRVPPHERAVQERTTSYLDDMRLGVRYIRDHQYLIAFFTFIGVLLFLISPAAFLTPLQVVRTFGADVWRLTAIEIAFSVGMIAGGALMGFWGGFNNRMHTMLLSAAVMGVCTVALGVTGNFWLYLAFMALFGIFIPLLNTPSAVLLQEHVESDYLGRVFSVNTMLFTSVMPLGMLLFGPMAEVVSVELILIVTGTLILASALLAFRNTTLISAGIPAAPTPESPGHGVIS